MSHESWEFGTILSRRRNKNRVLFIRMDPERQRMLGGGSPQMIAMRLDNADGTSPRMTPVGSIGNYTTAGWASEEAWHRAAVENAVRGMMSSNEMKKLAEEILRKTKAEAPRR